MGWSVIVRFKVDPVVYRTHNVHTRTAHLRQVYIAYRVLTVFANFNANIEDLPGLGKRITSL